MVSQTFDAKSIGPRLDLAEERIPPHVGAHLATLYGCENRIENWGEWVEVIRAASEATAGEPPTEDDLCQLADGAHTVELDDETKSFVCVLDPLAVPFLRETPGTVHSVTPEDGEAITIDVEADGLTVDAADGVVSVGVSRNPAVDGTPTHEDIYAASCPYIHVFASVDEYERWASTVDAATTSVPVDVGVAIARELTQEMFDAKSK